MGGFINLDDSPMFHKQIQNIENQTEELRNRCQRLYKDSKKYTGILEEACIGDTFMADSFEAFGGGQDDPVSVSIGGGPVMSKFIAAFRELATYKEVLRSQVEHVLIDRLAHFLSVDLQDAKESRRRFDKSIHAYDQAREKFASLKKSTKDDVIAESEEDLLNSKSAFERGRFNLVNALMNVEAKKKYEFLESFSAIMDAHLRYFKQGYELLSQLEPFILQVLTYAQQSKELANNEQDNLAKRIQEFRTQAEMDQSQASDSIERAPSALIQNGVSMDSYKDISAIMQASSKGEVQTIKQGYLLKRSSSLRSDWKRRFFVLDSNGTLYYYRTKGSKYMGSPSFPPYSTPENNSVFGRFRQRHRKTSSIGIGEENMGCNTVDLYTSIIKIDAEDTDLRLCFRIISPAKSYTLQAENETDRSDWMNKITGVTASLLHSHLQQDIPSRSDNENLNTGDGASFDVQSHNYPEKSPNDMNVKATAGVSNILREIPGNNHCAECGASEPDWASLNLGILMCIECSGVHRNLGVHISKVRSITLDVRVWEPTILNLFQSLGNTYCNSIWEESLLEENGEEESNDLESATKPGPKDPAHQKEKYIQAKYAERRFTKKQKAASGAASIWEAVKTDDVQQVYRLIVTSSDEYINNMANTTYEEVVKSSSWYHHVHVDEEDIKHKKKQRHDPAACHNVSKPDGGCLQGCSLLHLAAASQSGKAIMLELLLQFGADVNKADYHGRTPLHHCIAKNNYHLAKFLLKRGGRASIRDGGGLSVLERAMEMGAITDEELFVMLVESQ